METMQQQIQKFQQEEISRKEHVPHESSGKDQRIEDSQSENEWRKVQHKGKSITLIKAGIPKIP